MCNPLLSGGLLFSHFFPQLVGLVNRKYPKHVVQRKEKQNWPQHPRNYTIKKRSLIGVLEFGNHGVIFFLQFVVQLIKIILLPLKNFDAVKNL